MDAVVELANDVALLRIAAVGSVDDGKSTLIGRLLHDTQQLFDDQIEAVGRASAHLDDDLDLSLFTDGLRAEREQGITIDVAYRYAAAPQRRFIIADCPGHVEYTRNMATGSSLADVVIMAVDAQRGVREQTRRHACLAALFGVSQMIVCVNKMDAVDWSEERFGEIAGEIGEAIGKLGVEDISVIPLSALRGDNVVSRRDLSWYDGPTLFEALTAATPGEWVHATRGGELFGKGAMRLVVQMAIRGRQGERRYAGMVTGAPLHEGDAVTLWPNGKSTTLGAIYVGGARISAAEPGLSIEVELADDLDVSRGAVIAAGPSPLVTTSLEATVCWFGREPLTPNRRIVVKVGSTTVAARLESIEGVVDVTRLGLDAATELVDNQIGRVTLRTAAPVVVDAYVNNRMTGAFIVIDRDTHVTVGAGMAGPLPFPAS